LRLKNTSVSGCLSQKRSTTLLTRFSK
jgi:hypothetical protein